ncbi:MAG: DedA family protein [Methanomassiliicoccales archaeon]
MGIIEWGILFIKNLILDLNYPGLILLMAIESACVPIPSEIIMPFAGWLVYEREMDLLLASLSGTLGCTIGSLFAYAIGYYGGRAFILRYGKYFLIDRKAIDAAERWFSKYGDLAVFLSRLMPVIRTFISLPAGIGRMNLLHFTILTFVGSFPWCFGLVYLGFALGPSWEGIIEVFRGLDVLILIALAVIIAWVIFRKRERITHRNE